MSIKLIMIFLPRFVQRFTLSTRIGLSSNIQLFYRKCGTKPDDQNRESNSVVEGYKAIYKFPAIRNLSAFNRLKIYHTVATFLSVPACFILASEGLIDPEYPMAAAQIGSSIAAFLFITSIVTNRYVGFIYFNEKKDTVKIAYVDYWGNRKEKEVKASDIVPLSDLSTSFIHHVYKPVLLYSGEKHLKISSKYGVIIDKEKYNKIFLLEIK